MQGVWHATRIESSSGNGMPDVSYGVKGINGFMELKYMPRWPKLATTRVKLPLRLEQEIWIRNRGGIAGNVWVLCRVEDDFFLFNDAQALCASQGQLVKWWFTTNFLYCHGRIDFTALYRILKEGY
jgi:hypothetical protein